MNEFQQYQQQLQMQRMMEMQQARMQQLQQQQNNMMLFSQQRAAAASFFNPMGATPMMGGPFGMGTTAGGGVRQGFVGTAADAGLFNFAGIGTSGGFLGTGFGNRIGFRFADANRAITQARAQDQLAGLRAGFLPGLGASVLDTLGLGAVGRSLGIAGFAGINDAAAGMQDIFGGVRGASASGIEGRGISREFATRALLRSSGRLGAAMPELNTQEIRNIQGLAMDTMSTAQLTQAARSESEFDKVMESQEALLKKIAENTKMSVDEIKETNKVFKGQGGVGGSMQAMRSISAAVAGMGATTDATQQELMAMGAGFRSGARNLGMRGLDSVAGLMMSRMDAQLGRFNRGLIDETDMAAFGGTTAAEQAAATQQALLQRSRQFAVTNQTTLGLLGGNAGAIAASQGFGGLQQAIGAQIAADPINAAANAVFTREGQALLDRNTIGAMQTAFQEANAFRRGIPGAGRGMAIQRFAQSMGLTPQQALTQFERIEGMQTRIEALGAAGRGLSPDVLDAVDVAARKTGLGDRSREVAQLIQNGVAPEEAIRQAYTPKSREDVEKMAAAQGGMLGRMSAERFTPGRSSDAFMRVAGSSERSNAAAHLRRGYSRADITVDDLLRNETRDDFVTRGDQYDTLFSGGSNTRRFMQSLADKALGTINIANQAPQPLGSATNPNYTILVDREGATTSVGSD